MKLKNGNFNAISKMTKKQQTNDCAPTISRKEKQIER